MLYYASLVSGEHKLSYSIIITAFKNDHGENYLNFR